MVYDDQFNSEHNLTRPNKKRFFNKILLNTKPILM